MTHSKKKRRANETRRQQREAQERKERLQAFYLMSPQEKEQVRRLQNILAQAHGISL